MKHIFPDYTYGPGPRANCWWDQTIAAPDWPAFDGEARCDVAIVGGGFTGITAALRLADAGLSVTVLEAGAPGFGASGRNGGFCCLGGGKIKNADLTRQFGNEGRKHYRATEVAAIHFVAGQLDRYGIDADTHSNGETMLAHNPRVARGFDADARIVAEDYGVEAQVHSAADLPGLGLTTSDAHGAITVPVGFGLNPRKYLFGVAAAAQAVGARLCSDSQVTAIEPQGDGHLLRTARGTLRADRVIIATNGYSSEDLPDWLAARYMPAQSSVLVTRPMTPAELDAQGWTSPQMTYDSRNLLHYFRLMPDNRMIFGMRGGILSSARVDALALQRVRHDFEAMFPAWRHVETPFGWSGMVCLARNQTPYIGPVPGRPGLYASLAYHGNGVAMGSFAGHLIAGELLGSARETIPAAMRRPMTRFPFGPYRRILVPPVYLSMKLADL
ncbi:Gamma-glutamylputrescine oxidoreductase [Marinibacterium anthonyi]|nr:Gamma-glutamylputrescine oxidoreductase [Marinibacterium anthonyi]